MLKDIKMLKRAARFITDKLPWLIIAAGLTGFLWSSVANFLSPVTPYLLAVMVAGSGFNLSLGQVFQVRSTLKLTFLALLLQLSLLPLLGFGLYQILPNSGLAIGMLALGVAPSEITSALMTMLAGGNLVLATRLMAFSIMIAAFTTPLWLGLFLGQRVPFDFGGMLIELGLVISVPFLLASGLRTRFSGLAKYEAEFSGLSALAVIILIFVVGGSLASFGLSREVLWLALACLGFNLSGYLLGYLTGLAFKQSAPQTTALIFSSGMREFGIATTVAINFLPAGAALAPALYGFIMMTSASLLVGRLKNRV